MNHNSHFSSTTSYRGHASDAIRDAIAYVRTQNINQSQPLANAADIQFDIAPTNPKHLAQMFFASWLQACHLGCERPTQPLSFNFLECESCFLFASQHDSYPSSASILNGTRTIVSANSRLDLGNLSYVYDQIASVALKLVQPTPSDQEAVCCLLVLPRPTFKKTRGYIHKRGMYNKQRDIAVAALLKATIRSTPVVVFLNEYPCVFIMKALVPVSDNRETSLPGLAYIISGFIKSIE